MADTIGFNEDSSLIQFLFSKRLVGLLVTMVPSAAPMVLLFAAIHRRRRQQQQPVVPVTVFLAGYLVVWATYSAAATLAQWGLHTAALLSASMQTTSAVLGGVLLVGAGLFQWSPLKRVCLTNCRSPLAFVMTKWREGSRGAFAMGTDYGLYCVGCCWMLMALLFVAGVMNLMWVAALAIVVLVEKVVPGGERIARAIGIGLVAAGVVLIVGAWRAP